MMTFLQRLFVSPTVPTFLTASLLTGLLVSQAISEAALTVSGDVSSAQGAEEWRFSLEDLQSLPAVSFETETIWTDGSQQFEGVSLKVLLEHVGAKSGELRATAINDYAVSIPTADAIEGGPIVAYLRNGEDMSLRDKGPLWVVYPFSDNIIYKSEEYYSRSIWQLNRIEVIAAQ